MRNELTALYKFKQHLMVLMIIHLYGTVTRSMVLYSMLVALGRVVSFEACCHWALPSVQITRHYPTI